jgi:hypothetical protein
MGRRVAQDRVEPPDRAGEPPAEVRVQTLPVSPVGAGQRVGDAAVGDQPRDLARVDQRPRGVAVDVPVEVQDRDEPPVAVEHRTAPRGVTDVRADPRPAPIAGNDRDRPAADRVRLGVRVAARTVTEDHHRRAVAATTGGPDLDRGQVGALQPHQRDAAVAVGTGDDCRYRRRRRRAQPHAVQLGVQRGGGCRTRPVTGELRGPAQPGDETLQLIGRQLTGGDPVAAQHAQHVCEQRRRVRLYARTGGDDVPGRVHRDRGATAVVHQRHRMHRRTGPQVPDKAGVGRFEIDRRSRGDRRRGLVRGKARRRGRRRRGGRGREKRDGTGSGHNRCREPHTGPERAATSWRSRSRWRSHRGGWHRREFSPFQYWAIRRSLCRSCRCRWTGWYRRRGFRCGDDADPSPCRGC